MKWEREIVFGYVAPFFNIGGRETFWGENIRF